MKRILSTLTLLLCFAFTAVNAQVITAERAAEIANSFFSAGVQKSAAARGVVSSPSLTSNFDSNDVTETASAEPTFYVLTNPEGGFVIVSGEETENPIIGYSLDGTIDVNNLPDGFVGYMTDIDAQVKSLREYNANNPQKAAAARSAMQRAANFEYNATTMGNIVKDLNTAPWGQGAPFNNLCYVGATGTTSKAKTGCGPTAFAILCYYYKWPASGVGTVTHQGTGENMELGHTYDYANMRNDNYPSGYSEAEANAIAVLMRDLGWANQVGYGTSSTSYSETAQHMVDHFRFKSVRPVDHGASLAVVRSTLGNDTQWKTYIKNNLDAGYPIPYASTTDASNSGRHIYILDGYTDNDYYHFNWGWSGQGNGWFTLDNMVPDDYSNYSNSHKAYYIIPDATTYTVRATATPSNMGTVSINGGTAGTTVSADLLQGVTATLTAHPADGYALANWTKNGVIVGTKNTLQVKVGASDNDYVANFADEANVIVIQDYTINATSGTELTGDKVQEWAFNRNNDYPAELKLTSTAESINRNDNNIQLHLISPKTSETYTLSVQEGYEITQYTIRCKATSSYNIKVAAEGQEITPTNSYADYKFVRSNTLARTTSNSASFTVTGNTGRYMQVESITVTVAKEGANVPSTPTTYTINVNAETGGNAYVNGTNTSVTVDAGTDVTLQAYPDGTNYTFAGWYNGNSLVSSNNPYTFALNSNVTYTAKFNAVATTYTVTTAANPAAGGTAKFAVGTGSQKTQGDVENGTQITLYAVANTGYNFVNWTLGGNVVGTAATCNVTVSQTANYVANFEAVQQGGSSSTNLAGKYFRLKVYNDGRYMNVKNHTEHEQKVTAGGVNIAAKVEDSNAQIFFFEQSGNGYMLKDGDGYYIKGLEWSVDASSTTSGSVLLFEETAIEDVYYIKWNNTYKGDERYFKVGADSNGAGDHPYCDVAANQKETAAAKWVLEEVVYYTVTATAGEGGSVSPLTSTVKHGASVTLTATPSTGYSFAGWYNGETKVSDEVNYTVTNVTANAEYVANFEINTYTISATASPGTAGSATASPATVEHGASVTLTAQVNDGYHFVNWTKDGVEVSTDANYTIDSVTADGEYVANFEEIVVNATLTDAQGNTYNVQLSGFTTGITIATVATKLTAKYPYITLGDNAALNGSNAAYTYTNMVELPFKVSSVSDATKTYRYNIYYPSNGDARNPNYIADLNDEDAVVDMAASPEHAYGENPTYNTKAGNPMISWAIYSANNSLEFVFKNELTNKYITVESVVNATGNTQNVKFVDNAGAATAFTLLKDATDSYNGDYALVANIDETTGYLCAAFSDKDYVTHFDSNEQQGAWVKFVEVDYEQYIKALDDKLIKFDVGDDKHLITDEIQPMINALVTDYGVNITKSQFEAYFDAIDAMDAENWPKLSLTIAPDNSGTTTIAGEEGVTRKYVPTGNLTINATPTEGYCFVSWTDGTSEVSTEANYKFNITAATELTANFEKIRYTVSVTAGEGGSAMIGTETSTTVEHGGSVTLTAVESNGYEFVNWTKGTDVVSTDANYTVTNVTANAEYVANFQLANTPATHCNVTVNANISGTGIAFIHTGSSTDVTSGRYEVGSTITLTAVSDKDENGYLFAGWYVGGECINTETTCTVTLSSDVIYTAMFEEGWRVRYSCNYRMGYIRVLDADSNDIGGTNYVLVKKGSTIQMLGVPESGYEFKNWTANATSDPVSSNNPYRFAVEENMNLTANFEPEHYVLTVRANNDSYGTVTAESGTFSSDEWVKVGIAMTATITAVANDGYKFVNWTKDSEIVSTDATYTVPSVDYSKDLIDAEYIANFLPIENATAGKYYRIGYDGFDAPAAASAARAAGDIKYTLTPKDGGMISGSKTSEWISPEINSLAIRMVSTTANGDAIEGIQRYSDAVFKLMTSVTSPISTIKYTLSAPDGYIISNYSFQYNQRSANNITFRYDGNEINITNTTVYDLSVEPNKQTTEFTLTSSTFNQNAYLLVKNFTVTIQPVGSGEGEGEGTPETPEIPANRYYIQGQASGVSGKANALLMTQETGAASIFYYADNKLMSYKTGTYVNENGDTRGLQNVGVEGGDVEIIDNKIKVSSGTTMVYLHANEDNGTYFVDRCTSKTGDDNGDPEHNFILEEVTLLPVTISDAGYASWYAPVAVIVPEGLEAYYLLKKNIKGPKGDRYALMSKIECGVIPANEGVILTGKDGEKAAADTYYFEITTIEDVSDEKRETDLVKLNNILEGTVAAAYIQEGDYVLYNGNKGVGLYPVNANQASYSHKAYLPASEVPAPAGAALSAGFRFSFGGTTTVEDVEIENEREEIYDLTGRKLEGISGTGIYIINGKKVIVK